MMRTTALTVASILLLVVALAAGQQSAPPASSTLGSIRGTATDSEGAAVNGFFVAIFPSDQSKWSGPDSSARLKRVAISGGRFEVTDLPAGSYQLVLATDAMLTDWPAAPVLTRLNGHRPLPIQVAAGENLGVDVNVTIANGDIRLDSGRTSHTEMVRTSSSGAPLPPGRGRSAGPPAPTAPGAISGRVMDADGKPVAVIEVQAMRPVTLSGTLQLARFGASATTDADGRYILVNRSPGDYLVAVAAFALDSRTMTTIQHAPAPVQGPNGSLLAYVATFYGGATAPENARRVTVATSEIAGVDVQLIRRAAYELRGSVQGIRSGGQFRRVVLLPADNTNIRNPLSVQQTTLSDNGTFTFAAVPDGAYQILFSDPVTGWAAGDVRVAGRSPDALSMALRPPMNVSGRFEFRGNTPPPTFDSIPMSVQYGVELRPAQSVPGLGFSRLPLRGGDTFSARGTGPGPLQLRATAPAPWVQVAGIVNGIDTLDLPIAPGADTNDALIVFADHQTSLLVKVTDAADQPVANVGVLVFSDDSRYWPVRSRRVQSGQTMPGGGCALGELPPGQYFVVASREIGPSTQITPAVIEQLKSRALPFELAAGESRSVQVRVR